MQIALRLDDDKHTTVSFNVEDVAMLGREDKSTRNKPQIDLTPYGGSEKGVSRQHAILMTMPDGLAIMDLGSTNGTLVNGIQLKTGQKYTLCVGDTIYLGTLKMVVKQMDRFVAKPRPVEEDDTAINIFENLDGLVNLDDLKGE